MSASPEHDLIVVLITRYIRQQGFQIVALESSLSWLFGASFKLPLSIVRHRPDVIGVRAKPPYISVGEAKTCRDLRSKRTARQLIDFSTVALDDAGTVCQVVVGVPQDCQAVLQNLIKSLGISDKGITVLPVPRAILHNQLR